MQKSRVSRNHPITLSYEDLVGGDCCANLVVDECVVIIAPADKTLDAVVEMSLLRVWKSSEFEVGVLVNFGEKLEFRREVHTKCIRA